GHDHGGGADLGAVDAGATVALQDAAALDDLDPVLAHQPLDALPELVDHPVPPAGDAPVVEGDPWGDDAELLAAVAHLVQQAGGLQQRLGRDAADVQAGAAELGPLHDRDPLAELRRPDRRRVPAGPAAQDQDVELSGHGGSPSDGARVARGVDAAVPAGAELDVALDLVVGQCVGLVGVGAGGGEDQAEHVALDVD